MTTIEKLRSEADGDLPNQLNDIGSHPTGNNQREIRCGICGSPYFVDDAAFERLETMIKYDADNQFICEECEGENQDSAFER